MCIGLKAAACNFFLIIPAGVVLLPDVDEGVAVAAPTPGFGEVDHFFGRLALKMGVLVEA